MSARQKFRRGERVRLKHHPQVFRISKFVPHADCEGHYELHGTQLTPWQSQLVKVFSK
jgi:hypothetical protein